MQKRQILTLNSNGYSAKKNKQSDSSCPGCNFVGKRQSFDNSNTFFGVEIFFQNKAKIRLYISLLLLIFNDSFKIEMF